MKIRRSRGKKRKNANESNQEGQGGPIEKLMEEGYGHGIFIRAI